MSVPKSSLEDAIYHVLIQNRKCEQKISPEIFQSTLDKFIENNKAEDQDFNKQVSLLKDLCDRERLSDLSPEITKLFMLFFNMNVPDSQYEPMLLNLQNLLQIQKSICISS